MRGWRNRGPQFSYLSYHNQALHWMANLTDEQLNRLISTTLDYATQKSRRRLFAVTYRCNNTSILKITLSFSTLRPPFLKWQKRSFVSWYCGVKKCSNSINIELLWAIKVGTWRLKFIDCLKGWKKVSKRCFIGEIRAYSWKNGQSIFKWHATVSQGGAKTTKSEMSSLGDTWV